MPRFRPYLSAGHRCAELDHPRDLPGEGTHLLSSCSGSRVMITVALISRTLPFGCGLARRPGLPSVQATTGEDCRA